jgi:hypothetical protein
MTPTTIHLGSITDPDLDLDAGEFTTTGVYLESDTVWESPKGYRGAHFSVQVLHEGDNDPRMLALEYARKRGIVDPRIEERR